MTFNTPQADIDRCLEIEKAVKPEEMALYLECMNGVALSQRIAAPRPFDAVGRDVRDGCILTWVFVQCRPKPEPVVKKRRGRKEEDRKKQQEQDERDIEILDKEAGHL